jgi:L-asparagine oxygenase
MSTPILNWGRDVKEYGFGLLRNVPIGLEIPLTPTLRGDADKHSMTADRVIGAISSMFGILYTYSNKATRRHIQNLYPCDGDEYTQLGSSIVELEWHVEDACHVHRPSWLVLLCLRGDETVVTKVVRACDLQLPETIVRDLRELQFKICVDETFVGDKQPQYLMCPILSGPEHAPNIVFDPAYTSCVDVRQEDLLRAVSKSAELVQWRHALIKGDLLVLNNQRVVHARTAFQPRKNGSDRWLKRALLLEGELSTFLRSGFLPSNG